MRISSKGQVTIPAALRVKAALLPGTEVELEPDPEGVRVRPASAPRRAGHGASLVARLRGRASSKLSTSDAMALTRGR